MIICINLSFFIHPYVVGKECNFELHNRKHRPALTEQTISPPGEGRYHYSSNMAKYFVYLLQ